MGIIRGIKRLFGKYDSEYEYWVNVSDIKVNPEWRKTLIGKNKWKRKKNYWYRTGEFESKVILDRDFNLLDGYSTVRIAETRGIDKIPAYFVDREEYEANNRASHPVTE